MAVMQQWGIQVETLAVMQQWFLGDCSDPLNLAI